MESGRKFLFNAKEVAEQWPEFQGEEGVSIGDNWVLEFVMTYYHIYDGFCKPGYIEVDHDQFVVDHLCELINNNQNKIVTISFSID